MLREARALANGSGLVFASVRGGPLSELAIAKMVRDLGVGAVPHGFRSSFRDWAAECSDAPREVCELALAHVNTNSIEAAYRRTDLFERRRVLMDQWAAFLAGSEDEGARGSSSAMRSRIGSHHTGARGIAKREVERGEGRGDGDDEACGPHPPGTPREPERG